MIKSFLMIGQSNMAGRGEFEDIEEIRNPNCFMLRTGFWEEMREPVNPDHSIFNNEWHSGVSLASTFADETAKYYKERVGLIPCAHGGTSIDQWMPGEILYDHAVMMTKLAMRTSTLSGILWHQGEQDATSVDSVYAHKEKFLKMITSLRKELGAENLPLIIGELSEDHATREFRVLMNEQYRESAKILPCCSVASAKDLTLKKDGIHFDSVSLGIFGKRYFEEYKKLR
ncbi:MAG: sialate O-acetylesterase [Clostridia bacterium]|nr:sialate O-acetylesterase [Clostridia bacterium]